MGLGCCCTDEVISVWDKDAQLKDWSEAPKMRAGRALSALAAPTSVVDALFERGNGQQEDATGMPAGKRSRGDGDEDDGGDANHALAYKLFTLSMCDARTAELRDMMAASFPHIPIEPAFRSAEAEPTFRSLSAHDDDDPPGAREVKPWVEAEQKRVDRLRDQTVASLRQHFRPDQLMDPIFRPYDDEATKEAYNQSTVLDAGMSQLGMAQSESPTPA